MLRQLIKLRDELPKLSTHSTRDKHCGTSGQAMLMRLQRAEKGAVCGPSARSASEACEAGLDFSEVVVELRSRTQAVRGQTVPAEPSAGMGRRWSHERPAQPQEPRLSV